MGINVVFCGHTGHKISLLHFIVYYTACKSFPALANFMSYSPRRLPPQVLHIEKSHLRQFSHLLSNALYLLPYFNLCLWCKLILQQYHSYCRSSKWHDSFFFFFFILGVEAKFVFLSRSCEGNVTSYIMGSTSSFMPGWNISKTEFAQICRRVVWCQQTQSADHTPALALEMCCRCHSDSFASEQANGAIQHSSLNSRGIFILPPLPLPLSCAALISSHETSGKNVAR